MKCPNCYGPLTKVRTLGAPSNPANATTTLYRCIVCGSDIEVAARRRVRRRTRYAAGAFRPAKMKLMKKAS
jgi:hypothetical protein